MIIKGFVHFKKGEIPFVIENYCMELFTDDLLLKEFCEEYNFKDNYILQGMSFDNGIHKRKATFFVERSIGSTCYLRCYIINMSEENEIYENIGFQSLFLDDIFRYQYEYLDTVRKGINLSMNTVDVYKVPFYMDNLQYELTFRIGDNNKRGLLEDYNRKGEVVIPLHTNEIQECYDITKGLYRFAMFMTSQSEVPFKHITLYNKGIKVGWLFCPLVSENVVSWHTYSFYKFDVMKYVPKILNNIAQDSGNKITKSIPLGHLGNFDSIHSPKRFMEQIMAFEYIFDKLDHKKAQDSRFSLKDELKSMFDEFLGMLSSNELDSEKISKGIKELRRSIAHGYSYYYDFKDNPQIQHLMYLLDDLIKCMSLKQIGFSKEEISNYIVR
ncbi:MAG: hypothetical protein KHZ91_13065 [Firmicutes bacterium]|nr:hypothetical protein [Bacillota bacterium]